MGFEEEAAEELYSKVWCHRSTMRRELNRGAHGEVFALRLLAERGGMTPSQLGDGLRVSSGRVSTVLSSLEKKGFVTRKPDPSDRRVVRVAITDTGRARIEKDVEDARSAVRWIFSQMGSGARVNSWSSCVSSRRTCRSAIPASLALPPRKCARRSRRTSSPLAVTFPARVGRSGRRRP